METNCWSSKILIIGGSESGKLNSLFNLKNQQQGIDKIYWYVKDTYEAKYKFQINKSESSALKHFNNSKVFYWILKWYGWYLYKKK